MKTHRRAAFSLLIVVLVSCLTPRTALGADTALDGQCRDFAAGSNVVDFGYPPMDIAVLSGCAQDAQGTWFWPQTARDPRLVGAFLLTGDERAQTIDLWQRVTDQSLAFDRVLSGYYDLIDTAASARPNFLVSLDEYTADAISAGWGVRPEYQGGPGVKSVAKVYEPILVDFLTDPNNVALSDYLVWWSSRRAATIPASVRQSNPMARAAYIEAMGFNRAPWPWEIRRSLTVDEYMKWALDNGRVPATVQPTATPMQSASGDCSDMARWLHETSVRSAQASRIYSGGPLPFSVASAGPASTWRRYAAALRDLADDQEASNPPDAARAANALIVEELRGFAAAFDAMAEAIDSGDQGDWDRAIAMFKEPRADSTAAWQETERLREACGIG
jgi:hypothetical protein